MHRPTRSLAFLASASAAILALALVPGRPVAASSAASQRGQEVFSTAGCAHCHGPLGVGGDRGPDLQLVRKRHDAAWIRNQITNGSQSMPAFGDKLSPAQIDDLVAFLRTKRKFVATPKAAAPPAPKPAESDQ